MSEHVNGVTAVDMNDRYVFSGSWDKSIRVWDTQTDQTRVFQAHVNGVRCVQAGGPILVSGAADKIMFVWNIEAGQAELILKVNEFSSK